MCVLNTVTASALLLFGGPGPFARATMMCMNDFEFACAAVKVKLRG